MRMCLILAVARVGRSTSSLKRDSTFLELILPRKILKRPGKTLPMVSRLWGGQRASFELIDPKPHIGQRYFAKHYPDGEWIDVAVSIQTLDFLSDTDCQTALNNIYDQMKPGAVIYASFNGTKLFYYNHSHPLANGDGLRHVKFNNGRVSYDLLINFCDSREEMRDKFSMFKSLYLDYYDSSFREEDSEFRWTFCGIKE